MAVFHETHSEQFGRHLASARDLPAGNVVLEQRPYAAVLYDDQVALRCDWCFQTAQPGTTLSRCSQSKFAHYCSRSHQLAAWRAYYKQECAALVACAPHMPPATVRLAAKVLWRRQRCVPSADLLQVLSAAQVLTRVCNKLTAGMLADNPSTAVANSCDCR